MMVDRESYENEVLGGGAKMENVNGGEVRGESGGNRFSEAAVASMRGSSGSVVLRVIESEGLFESLVLRVINLSLVVRVS